MVLYKQKGAVSMIKRFFKWVLRILGSILGLVLVAVAGLVVFLTVTEYRPADRQPADMVALQDDGAKVSSSLTVFTWNIGYGGLGEESDFFMDGGTMVNPPSQETVDKNLAGIQKFIQSNPADAWLFQEVDLNSARTGYTNELNVLSHAYGGNSSFAYNYKCPFVPIPWPPMGQIESGIATLTQTAFDYDTERVALPCPFRWPVRSANIKRCLLITRLPIEGSDKQLVLVNLHLEAYDSGEGKIAQTRLLMEVLQEEYEKGNYVIAGGDFNQTFPGGLEQYPILDESKWTPGILDAEMLPEGWQFACDGNVPTCRLLDKPYDETCQKYLIDGFILSPNVQLNLVETVDLGFEHSDHNPVKLQVSLENID